jgi:hypothetical protein
MEYGNLLRLRTITSGPLDQYRWHVVRFANPNYANRGIYRINPSAFTNPLRSAMPQTTANNSPVEIRADSTNNIQRWQLIPHHDLHGNPNYPFNTEIRFDTTYQQMQSNTVTALNMMFQNVSMGVSNTFPVGFANNNPQLAATLNGGNCPRGVNVECNAQCGNNVNCNNVLASGGHHKSSVRLLETTFSGIPNNRYVVRVVGHAICRFENNNHYRHSGLGERSGAASRYYNTLATSRPDPDRDHLSMAMIVQHELAHNLSAFDCSSNECIMNGNRGSTTLNVWCTSCRNQIFNWLSI